LPDLFRREATALGFVTPGDFTIKERGLNYANGDKYEVRMYALASNSTDRSRKSLCGVPAPAPPRRPALNSVTSPPFSLHLQGETLGNLRHGRGTHTEASGACYVGQWRYDRRDGRGRATWPDGRLLEGDWRDDAPHG
jgi:hypothetical protein